MTAREVFVHRRVRILALDEDELAKAASNGVFITGFKGFGAVGYITTTHIVSKLGLRRVGYVVPRMMPEVVTMDSNGIVAPFEFYASSEKKIVVLVNHDFPVERERDAFAEAVVLLMKRLGVRMAIFVGGYDARFRRGEERFRWVASGGFRAQFKEPPIDRDLYVVGPLALMIFYSEVHGLPAVTILPYTETARPDPAAAAVAVEVISDMLGLKIDVSELLEMAKRIEEAIERVEQQKEAVLSPPSTASERLYT